MNIAAKILNEVVNKIQQHKELYTITKWLHSKYVKLVQHSEISNITNQIIRLKKNHVFIWIDSEKSFDKTQPPFMIQKQKQNTLKQTTTTNLLAN